MIGKPDPKGYQIIMGRPEEKHSMVNKQKKKWKSRIKIVDKYRK